LGYLDNISIDDVLTSALMATLATRKASPNPLAPFEMHKILDDLNNDQELTFALMQTACARKFRRRPDRDRVDRRPDTPHSDRAPLRTSPAKTNIKHLCQGAHGPDPYNKYTRQGAQEGGPAAFLCNFLNDHGVKTEKVLKKVGLAGADWDNPDSVHAIYVT
jgi:hypothetical protein